MNDGIVNLTLYMNINVIRRVSYRQLTPIVNYK